MTISRVAQLILLVGTQATTGMLFADVVSPTFASAVTGSCSQTSQTVPTAFAGCSSDAGTTDTIANAHATGAPNNSIPPGVISVDALAEGSLTTTTVSPLGSAEGSVSDSITIVAPGIDVGYIRIFSDLTGDFFLSCHAAGGESGGGECGYDYALRETATIQGNGLDSGITFVDQDDNSGVGLFVDGAYPSASVTVPTPGNLPLLVPVNFGQTYTLSYDLAIDAGINCLQQAGGLPCPVGGLAEISADFVDPLMIQVLDANLNPVADATILSADGINYSGTAVPEPRLFWPLAALLVVGSIVAWHFRRRYGLTAVSRRLLA